MQGMPCRELFLPKLDLQISLDPSLESALSYSHWKQPFVVSVLRLAIQDKHRRTSRFQYLLSPPLSFRMSHRGIQIRIFFLQPIEVVPARSKRCSRWLRRCVESVVTPKAAVSAVSVVVH